MLEPLQEYTHTHTHTGNLKEIKNIIKKIEILSLCSNWVQANISIFFRYKN